MEADDERARQSVCVPVCARVMDTGKGWGLDFAKHAALIGMQSTRIKA